MRGTPLRDFGGQDRYLRYDANAWAAIGDRLGIKIRLGHFQSDLLETPLPLGAIRTVIWGGLLHAEPDIDERLVGSWLDDENAGEVLNAFFSRFGATSPVQETILAMMAEAPTTAEDVAEMVAPV